MAVERPTKEWEEKAGEPDLPLPEMVTANYEAVLQLWEGAALPFRGVDYHVPPVETRTGLELVMLRDEWDRIMQQAEESGLTRDQRGDLEGVFLRAVKLFKQLVRPVAWWRRLLWPVTPNPFRWASNQEFVDLMGFLLASRMKSSIRSQLRRRAPGRRQ